MKSNLELHRFWFLISNQEQWYGIMRECRSWFGKEWRSMSKVRRKLGSKHSPRPQTVPVWFDVPDPRFATWIAVKMSLQAQSDTKYQTNK
jgi:hypothetical protein